MNHLLPIFMKLEKQPCLVVGGGKIALKKIKQLLDVGADVTVVSPEFIEEFDLLPVNNIKRKYRTSDIGKSTIVIAATNDEDINCKVYEDTYKSGIPVNVVDHPELCSFFMGSVFQEGDLKIAISTNGKCPSYGIYLKDHIQNMSKGLWGKAIDALSIKRKKIIQTFKTYAEKREVMGQLVKDSLDDIKKKKKSSGKVFLVGAGPGDPELITAKGLRVMQNADVILHDSLIHPYLVFEINPIANKVFIGKRKGKHSISQENIHLIMAQEAAKGKKIVRLKGGDPFVFGRGGEEILALAKANIPFEIIPGITAGLGAAAEFGIPLTHRDEATSTLFITGHQCDTSDGQDWEILAKLQSTLVFYMGTRRLIEIVNGLLDNGKDVGIPIAIIQNATLKSQKIIVSTLGSIMEECKKHSIMTPAIIIIGKVVNNHIAIQNYLQNIPSNMVDSLGDMDFDIWKNSGIEA